ncbi:basic proline-rich protein-like [Hippopotamus amphibius kiboko]|uniref:basic proline-rich protein-like n=1 Tax=Hippopotamus amphibius kiboko TaxID=575201 RepID=UPI0025956DC5|nr:basic proline-rich protein-like [Hippopotamus amphibius kiboko]
MTEKTSSSLPDEACHRFPEMQGGSVTSQERSSLGPRCGLTIEPRPDGSALQKPQRLRLHLSALPLLAAGRRYLPERRSCTWLVAPAVSGCCPEDATRSPGGPETPLRGPGAARAERRGRGCPPAAARQRLPQADAPERAREALLVRPAPGPTERKAARVLRGVAFPLSRVCGGDTGTGAGAGALRARPPAAEPPATVSQVGRTSRAVPAQPPVRREATKGRSPPRSPSPPGPGAGLRGSRGAQPERPCARRGLGQRRQPRAPPRASRLREARRDATPRAGGGAPRARAQPPPAGPRSLPAGAASRPTRTPRPCARPGRAARAPARRPRPRAWPRPASGPAPPPSLTPPRPRAWLRPPESRRRLGCPRAPLRQRAGAGQGGLEASALPRRGRGSRSGGRREAAARAAEVGLALKPDPDPDPAPCARAAESPPGLERSAGGGPPRVRARAGGRAGEGLLGSRARPSAVGARGPSRRRRACGAGGWGGRSRPLPPSAPRRARTARPPPAPVLPAPPGRPGGSRCGRDGPPAWRGAEGRRRDSGGGERSPEGPRPPEPGWRARSRAARAPPASSGRELGAGGRPRACGPSAVAPGAAPERAALLGRPGARDPPGVLPPSTDVRPRG